jgi:hypothetical protein
MRNAAVLSPGYQEWKTVQWANNSNTADFFRNVPTQFNFRPCRHAKCSSFFFFLFFFSPPQWTICRSKRLMHTEILLRPHVHPTHVSAFLNCLHIVNSRAKTGISDVTCVLQSNLYGTSFLFITTLMGRRSVDSFKNFQLCTTYLNMSVYLHTVYPQGFSYDSQHKSTNKIWYL